MLDVRFFRNRRFTAANAGITMVYFGMFGSMFLITQYLQTVLGFSALEAGLRMLPTAAIMICVAPLAPRLVERVGTKLVVGGGLVLAAIGLAGMSRVPGVGAKLAPLRLSADALSTAKSSIGGAVDVARSLPAPVGRVVVAAAKQQFVDGLGSALSVAALVVLVAAGVVFVYLPARAGDARESFEGPADGIASLTFAEAEGVLEADAAMALDAVRRPGAVLANRERK